MSSPIKSHDHKCDLTQTKTRTWILLGLERIFLRSRGKYSKSRLIPFDLNEEKS